MPLALASTKVTKPTALVHNEARVAICCPGARYLDPALSRSWMALHLARQLYRQTVTLTAGAPILPAYAAPACLQVGTLEAQARAAATWPSAPAQHGWASGSRHTSADTNNKDWWGGASPDPSATHLAAGKHASNALRHSNSDRRHGQRAAVAHVRSFHPHNCLSQHGNTCIAHKIWQQTQLIDFKHVVSMHNNHDPTL